MRLPPEDACENAVKSSDVEVAGTGVAEYLLHPLLHLLCRLIGKGQSKDIEGVDPLCQQVRNTCRQDLGLAASGARHDHDRTVHVQHRFLLPIVQFTDIISHVAKLLKSM